MHCSRELLWAWALHCRLGPESIDEWILEALESSNPNYCMETDMPQSPMESPTGTWHTPWGWVHEQTVGDCEGNFWIASNQPCNAHSGSHILLAVHQFCTTFLISLILTLIFACTGAYLFTHREPIKNHPWVTWPTTHGLLVSHPGLLDP